MRFLHTPNRVVEERGELQFLGATRVVLCTHVSSVQNHQINIRRGDKISYILLYVFFKNKIQNFLSLLGTNTGV